MAGLYELWPDPSKDKGLPRPVKVDKDRATNHCD